MKKLFILLAAITLMMGCIKEPLPEPVVDREVNFYIIHNTITSEYETPLANQLVRYEYIDDNNQQIINAAYTDSEGKITVTLNKNYRNVVFEYTIPIGYVVTFGNSSYEVYYGHSHKVRVPQEEIERLSEPVVLNHINEWGIASANHSYILGLAFNMFWVKTSACFSTFSGYTPSRIVLEDNYFTWYEYY